MLAWLVTKGHQLLHWLRKIPLLGWLAVLIAVLVVLYRRKSQLLQAQQEQAKHVKEALLQRRRVAQHLDAADALERQQLLDATQKHAESVRALEAASLRYESVSSAQLVDEINRYFQEAP